MSEHTKLSASKSHRWSKCPGSVKAEEGLPDIITPYGEEGRLAHLLAERMFFKLDYSDLTIPDGMVRYVQMYIDHLNSIVSRIDTTSIHIEKKVDFSYVVPDNNGTADAIIVQPMEGKLFIIDFKYGYDRVKAYENTQLLLYAMGAFNTLNLYDIESITLQVVQPRLEYHDTIMDSWTLSLSELKVWEGYLRAKGEEALQPYALRRPHEEACKYCKAKPTCPAIYKLMHEYLFNDPYELTTENLKVILDNSKLFQGFLEAVHKKVYDELLSGNPFNGYKLIPGKNVRKLKADAEEKLVELLGENAYTKSLRGVIELEKLIDKDTLKSLVYFQSYNPQMVKDDNPNSSLLEELNYDPV